MYIKIHADVVDDDVTYKIRLECDVRLTSAGGALVPTIY